MTASAEAVSCPKQDCEAGSAGECLEGHELLSECPNWPNNSSESAPAQTEEEEEDERDISLPHGRALSLAEAGIVTRQARTSLVVLAGDNASGKTTLLSAIYDKIQRGPFAGLAFAGSETLLGFEERCFLARTASGRSLANTERTHIREGWQLLHLRLQPVPGEFLTRDLLMTDVSGEAFFTMRDRIHEFDQLPVVKRADFFALLLDGARLIDKRQRHVVSANAGQLLRQLSEIDALRRASSVQVVVSKWDLLHDDPEASEYAMNAGSQLVELIQPYVREAKFLVVAAEPRPQTLDWGYGLEELLGYWATRPLPRPPRFNVESPELHRPFDRFAGLGPHAKA